MAHFVYVNDSGSGERRLCEVVNLFDDEDDEVSSPILARRAVIKLSEDKWVAFFATGNATMDDYVSEARRVGTRTDFPLNNLSDMINQCSLGFTFSRSRTVKST